MGYLVADPEVKSTTTGQAMARFSIATNRDWKTSEGEKHEVTDYHRVVAWRKLAEICGEYLRKGASVYLEGHLSTRKYQDKQGLNRSITEIVADMVNFISLKNIHENRELENVNLVEVPVVELPALAI